VVVGVGAIVVAVFGTTGAVVLEDELGDVALPSFTMDQVPPKLLMPLPDVEPAVLSPAKVYRGCPL
jgi:hypothetical protein